MFEDACRRPLAVGIGLLLRSFGNCAAIKAARLVWAPTESCVFVTTGQCVRETWGLLSTSEEQWRMLLSPAS